MDTTHLIGVEIQTPDNQTSYTPYQLSLADHVPPIHFSTLGEADS